LCFFPSETVTNQTVVELGAGTGFSGLVARLLGARHVVLTDYAPAVLANLSEIARISALPLSALSLLSGYVVLCWRSRERK
jgi:predicted nicotinamide N-methyase